jgi:hypothetical protein
VNAKEVPLVASVTKIIYLAQSFVNAIKICVIIEYVLKLLN